MYDNKDRFVGLLPPMFTVFTPTYNRRKTLPFVFECLISQTFKSFEWIIVDDGSTDSTVDLIPEWLANAPFHMRYYYQENQGKHVATNFAVEIAEGEHFLDFASDDRFTPDALEQLQKAWFSIPVEERGKFKGPTCRSIDPDTKQIIGDALPRSPFDMNSIELRLKYRIKGEMCGSTRTEIMKNYPSPVLNKNAKFYPETIIWFEIAKTYKVRYVDVGIRYYFRDQSNALTGKNVNRASANYYLWKYYINNVFEYARYSPEAFIKAFIGMSRDGLIINKTLKDMLNELNSKLKKFLFILFVPIGYLMFKMKI